MTSARLPTDSHLCLQAFFGLMALTMLGVRYKNDKRDLYLQHGGWLVKIGLWLLFNALPFFLPVAVVNSYGEGQLNATLQPTLLCLLKAWQQASITHVAGEVRGLRTFMSWAGWLARVGSGAFLCMQVLMLLDFVVTWNDSWVDKDDERWVANHLCLALLSRVPY